MNPTATITKNRITSIDFLRGTIMIIMALDHVRDYLFRESFYFDPLNLDKTTGAIFFTRWITHFCAPIFLLLTGTSAYLVGQRKSKKELSAFLVKRGVWLILLELIVTNFGWNFNIAFPMVFFITLWALGWSMILLGGLIYLQPKWILAISVILIAGHNLLDSIHVAGNTLPAFGWALLHDQQFFTWHGEQLLVGYPLIPFIAITPLGYCLGQLYTSSYDPKKRKKILLQLGGLAFLAFVLLRWSNVYGDPVKWTTQKDAFFTFLSFLDVNKYPGGVVQPPFHILYLPIGIDD